MPENDAFCSIQGQTGSAHQLSKDAEVLYARCAVHWHRLPKSVQQYTNVGESKAESTILRCLKRFPQYDRRGRLHSISHWKLYYSVTYFILRRLLYITLFGDPFAIMIYSGYCKRLFRRGLSGLCILGTRSLSHLFKKPSSHFFQHWPSHESNAKSTNIEQKELARGMCSKSFCNAFNANGPPRNMKKSLDLSKVEEEQMAFIGWIWYLKNGALTLIPSKLEEEAIAMGKILGQDAMDQSDLQGVDGNLIWIALGVHPILSTLQYAFLLSHWSHSENKSLIKMTKRELFTLTRAIPLSSVYLYQAVWTNDASKSAGAVVYTIQRRNRFLTYAIRSCYFSASWRAQLTVFVCSANWKTAFVHRLLRKEHINALEAAPAFIVSGRTGCLPCKTWSWPHCAEGCITILVIIETLEETQIATLFCL